MALCILESVNRWRLSAMKVLLELESQTVVVGPVSGALKPNESGTSKVCTDMV